MPQLLDLLVGAVVVDLVTVAMNYAEFVFVSKELTRWYTTMRLSAMLSDILIVVLYIVGGKMLAGCGADVNTQLLASLGVQMVGDVLFYKMFELVPRGTVVFDIFKDYAKEVGHKALVADAILVSATFLVALQVPSLSLTHKQLLLMVSTYVAQYVLYLK